MAWCVICQSIQPSRQVADIGLPVVTAFAFDGAIRRTIIDWKDNGSRSAAMRVTDWLDALVAPFLDAVPDLLITPVPSAESANRTRGARPLFNALRSVVPADHFVDTLSATRRRRDQARLSRVERARNLSGSMGWAVTYGHPVLVVDDVITTGSTLREAKRAITSTEAVAVLGCAIAKRERVKTVAMPAAGLR